MPCHTNITSLILSETVLQQPTTTACMTIDKDASSPPSEGMVGVEWAVGMGEVGGVGRCLGVWEMLGWRRRKGNVSVKRA